MAEPEPGRDGASSSAPRVFVSSHRHDYNLALFGPLLGGPLPLRGIGNLWPVEQAADLLPRLRPGDLLHVHWPEHLFAPAGASLQRYWERLEAFLDGLQDRDTRLVLTLHNRRPHHLPAPLGEELYRRWTARASLALHHSRWGERVMRATYPFPPDCRHEHLPHPHFASLMTAAETRTILEARLQLPSCRIRLGLLGRPSPEKRVDLLLRAFALAGRSDQQLLLTAALPGTPVHPDPRVRVPPRAGYLDRGEITAHTTVCDALLVAPDTTSFLTSGLPADALALGIPMVAPGGGYFEEILGPAGIYHDGTEAGVAAVLAGLEPEHLAKAAGAARQRRDAFDPRMISARLAALLGDLAAASVPGR